MGRRADIEGRLNLDSTGMQRGLQRAKQSVGSFVSSSIAKFGALLGAAGFGGLVNAAINLGSKISDLAIQLRIGTDELQSLQYAAKEAGVDNSVLERALRNVTLRTQEALDGNKRYAEALDRLGLLTEEFIALPTDKKMEAIAMAQARATDSGEAYRDVAVILGERAGPALQEVLQKITTEGFEPMTKAAKDAGQVMEKDTIQRLDKASDTISLAKNRLTIFVGEIVGSALPAFDKFGAYMRMVGGYVYKLKEGFSSFFVMLKDSVVTVFEPVILGFKGLAKGIEASIEGVTGNFEKAGILFKQSIDESKKAINQLLSIPKEIGNHISEHHKNLDNYNDAFGQYVVEQFEIIDAASAKTTANIKKDSKETVKAVESDTKKIAQNIQKVREKLSDSGDKKDEKKKRLNEIEIALIKARAAGNIQEAQALKNRYDLAKRIIELTEKGIDFAEALKIANAEANKTESVKGINKGSAGKWTGGQFLSRKLGLLSRSEVEANKHLLNGEIGQSAINQGQFQRSLIPQQALSQNRINMGSNDPKSKELEYLKSISDMLKKLDGALT